RRGTGLRSPGVPSGSGAARGSGTHMLVAVTGGTGFVGAHSVRALVDAGHDVRVLTTRRGLATEALGALGVDLGGDDLVEGDVRDTEAVRRLLDGADALLHAAGVVGVDDRDEA